MSARSVRPYQLNRALGMLFGVVWLSAYLMYVLAGRSVESAFCAILFGGLLTVLLVATRNALWKEHPDEMLGLK